MADADVSNTKSRYRSIICTECLTPLAFVEVSNVATRIEALEKRIEETAGHLNALAVTINQMANRMR
jgi:hypothetical protein